MKRSLLLLLLFLTLAAAGHWKSKTDNIRQPRPAAWTAPPPDRPDHIRCFDDLMECHNRLEHHALRPSREGLHPTRAGVIDVRTAITAAFSDLLLAERNSVAMVCNTSAPLARLLRSTTEFRYTFYDTLRLDGWSCSDCQCVTGMHREGGAVHVANEVPVRMDVSYDEYRMHAVIHRVAEGIIDAGFTFGDDDADDDARSHWRTMDTYDVELAPGVESSSWPEALHIRHLRTLFEE